MKEKLEKDNDPSFYATPLAIDSPKDFIDIENAIIKKDINIKTLRDLNKENPKSLDHAVFSTIDTRKLRKDQLVEKSKK
ncbi:MAG: hypothetical protein RSD40_06465, partial [Bacilli bacterium]